MTDKSAREIDSIATKVRNFVVKNTWGVLSTISKAHDSFPFGSITPYDITERGRLVLHVSRIAQHYKNMTADPRACLTVAERFPGSRPQAFGRASIMLRLHEVPAPEQEAVRKRYRDRFPESRDYEQAHDFTLFRGTPERIRWIGGFGEIHWIEGGAFCEAEPDPLAYVSMSALDHMNVDHQAALRDLVRAHGGMDPSDKLIEMIDCSSRGFTLGVFGDNGRTDIPVSFDASVDSLDALRAAIIEQLNRARKR